MSRSINCEIRRAGPAPMSAPTGPISRDGRRQWWICCKSMLLIVVLSLPSIACAGQGSMRGGNIPMEVPMPMMRFPPLMSMQFPKIKTIEVKPANDFIDGADLYRRHCSDCHGIQTTSDIKGMRFSQLSSAVAAKKAGMENVRVLKKDEITAIINALKKPPAS